MYLRYLGYRGNQMQCHGPLLPCAFSRERRARLGARGRARGAPRRVVCRGGALGEVKRELHRSIAASAPRPAGAAAAAAGVAAVLAASPHALIVFQNALYVFDDHRDAKKHKPHYLFSTLLSIPRARRCRTSSPRGTPARRAKDARSCPRVPRDRQAGGLRGPGVLVPNPYFAHVGEWEKRCAAWREAIPAWPARDPRVFWRGSVKPGCNPGNVRASPRSPSRPRATTSSTSAPRRSTRPIPPCAGFTAGCARRRAFASSAARCQRVRLRSLAPIPQPPGDHGRVVLAQPQLALADAGRPCTLGLARGRVVLPGIESGRDARRRWS